MTHIAPALIAMIVRIIVFIVQQNKEANIRSQRESDYRRFMRQVKHPAEYFLREPGYYSYKDIINYYRH